ncbi:MAG: serine--tRNA ligase, partial [Minisyncoccales bacterium]
MLDIKFIRKNPEKVKKGAKNKGYDVDVDLILKLDEEKRRILREIEKIRAEKNRGSREILKLREKEKEKRIFELKKLDEKEEKLGEKQKKIDQKLTELLYQIPNLPLEEVPIGKSELENIVLREIGEKTKFDFKPKSYLEIGEKLDLIDVKRAAKVSGTRFGYLKREAVLIEFAIVNFVFEKLTKRGFIPVIPPVMMRSEMVRGMGYIEQLDKKEAYYLPKDNLYLA